MEKMYENFVEDLRQELLNITGYSEGRIYYKKKEDFPQTSGDRLILKYYETDEVTEVCALYIRELYENYRNGKPMEEIIADIMEHMKGLGESEVLKKAQAIENYDRIKKDLFIRLINKDRNQPELSDAVYREMGDIALVLCACMGEISGCTTSMKIKKYIVDKWQKDEDTVFREALVNTYFMSPPRIYCWEKVFFQESYDGENFMNLLCDFPIRTDAVGNCLSTTKRTNGAVAVFYPGVAERLAALLKDSFYMVFTSIHEVMIHSVESVDPEDLSQALADTVRESTSEEDFLTLQIYRYDRESGLFSICCS